MNDKNGTFSPFDAADYLSTFDDIAAYLEAVMDEGDDDPAMIAQALGAIARSGNVSELARRAGMSREGLYKALPAPADALHGVPTKAQLRKYEAGRSQKTLVFARVIEVNSERVLDLREAGA